MLLRTLLGLLVFAFNLGFGQVVVYNEDFTLPDGTISDAGPTPWTRTYSGTSEFEVIGETFFAHDLDSEGVWTSGVIDISAYGYAVIDISGYVLFAGAGDYLRFYYKVDGGPETLFGSFLNGILTGAVESSAMVSGSSVQIVVRVFNNGGLDWYGFDDVIVTGVQTLYSRKTGNWTDNDPGNATWSISGLGGASCGCSPNSLTRVVIGNGNTVTVDAAGDAIDVEVRSGATLDYSANTTLTINRGGAISVESGGTINSGTNAGRQIVFNDPFTNNILVDGTLTIGDFDVNGAATLNFSGGGTVLLQDDLLVDAAATINFTQTGGFTITDQFAIAAAASVNFDHTGTLTVSNDLNLNGSASITKNSGTLTITDDLILNTSNSTLTNNAGAISISGDIFVNDNADDDNVITNASGATLSFVNVDANNGDLDILNSGTLNQSGNFIDISNADTNFDNLATGTWNWTLTPNTTYDTDIATVLNATASGNTFNYSGAGAQRIIPTSYHHLTLSNSGAKDGNNASFSVGGDWNVTGTASFTEGTSLITFNGSGAQSITNAAGETFSRVTVNKTGGSLTLNNNVTISGGTGTDLTLTQGVINTTTSAILIINDGVTTSGGDADSFVDGPIRKIGNDSFIFPTGDGTRWARIEISAPTGTTTEFTAQYFATPYSAGNTDATLTHVSGAEHWTLDRAVTTASVTVKLYWENSFSDINNFADLRVARFNGTEWVSVGNTAFTGAVGGPGTITSSSVGSFSPFTFGSAGGSNPLPVELTYFRAHIENNQAVLAWATATEKDNDYFTIERAVDIEKFEPIGPRIKGKGTTNQLNTYEFIDAHPVPGRSYYRLKQTDFDGTFDYSEIRVVDYFGPDHPVCEIYPTVAKQGSTLIIKAEGLDDMTELPLRLIDCTGKVVWEKTYHIKEKGYLNETIDLSPYFSSGVYILRGPTTYFTNRIIIN